MDLLDRHLVLFSALLAAALVLAALGWLVWQTLAAWRRSKAAVGDGTDVVRSVERSVARVEARARALQDRQEALSGAVGELGVQVGVAKTIARHAARALAILRAPLRYVGR